MITFPIAKINIGLNIVERRPDGYHNLQTVFYPIPLSDVLECFPMSDDYPSLYDADLKVTGTPIEGDEQKNLVVKAYNMLKADFPDSIPRLHIHLHKRIPTQAGMGGGSSDATYMLRLLNDEYHLGLSNKELAQYAVRLGADCPFFVHPVASYAEGIGEQLIPIDLRLDGWYMVIVKPDTTVSTREAFALVEPKKPEQNCAQIVMTDVRCWRSKLVNDFEKSVFAQYPEIGRVKERLYQSGAIYASMTGSGSALFALYEHKPAIDAETLGANIYYSERLTSFTTFST